MEVAELFPKLNFPEFEFKFEKRNNVIFILDQFRKNYFILTPEEWVRQNLLSYLVLVKKFPISLIGVEKQFKINKLNKRFDAVAYLKNAIPILLIECKAPSIKLNQQVFDQICRYNIALNVSFFLISNGINHICCKVKSNDHAIEYLSEIPNYEQLSTI